MVMTQKYIDTQIIKEDGRLSCLMIEHLPNSNFKIKVNSKILFLTKMELSTLADLSKQMLRKNI